MLDNNVMNNFFNGEEVADCLATLPPMNQSLAHNASVCSIITDEVGPFLVI